MEKFDVIVSGMNVVDVLVGLPEHTTSGAKHKAQKIVLQGGAPAGNAACVMAQLGLSTAFLGYTSNAPLSGVAKAELNQRGVHTKLLIPREGTQPAIAVVEITPGSGERTVYYDTQGYQPLRPEDINTHAVKNCQLVFVDGYDTEANMALLHLAKQYDKPSVLDLESGNRDVLLAMIQLGGHIVMPISGAQALTGEQSPAQCLQALSAYSTGQLVVTDGAQGSWAWQAGQCIHQPALSITPVDTTGCGDAFHGAYAYALLKGWPLESRLQFATAYAAIIAGHFGGRSYYPTLQEVEALTQKLTTSCL